MTSHNLMSDFLKDLIAGTGAGICSTVFGYPLDTIKVEQIYIANKYLDSHAVIPTESFYCLMRKLDL